MLTFVEIPEYLEILDVDSRKLGGILAVELAAVTEGDDTCLPAGTDISIYETAVVINIVSGCFKWFDGKRLVRLYSDGDWLFANAHGAGGCCKIVSDFGCQVRIIQHQNFLHSLSKNPALLDKWQHYQELQMRILLGLIGTLAAEDTTPNFRVKSLRPHEVILSEGANTNEVYVMLEGRAAVKVGERQVGNIEQDEVFGEISFLTEQPRSASVVAITACLVQIIEREQFALLIKSKPELLRRTAVTLAQRIVDLNTQLTMIDAVSKRP